MTRTLADLDPLLQWAVHSRLLTLGQALDADAFADGLDARVRAGEITEEEGLELAHEQAMSDGRAMLRARKGHLDA